LKYIRVFCWEDKAAIGISMFSLIPEGTRKKDLPGNNRPKTIRWSLSSTRNPAAELLSGLVLVGIYGGLFTATDRHQLFHS
jgi:hypothetical protein